MVAANLWGKDEDNPFEFSRESRQVVRSQLQLPHPTLFSMTVLVVVVEAEGDIDGFMIIDIELMRCEVFGSMMVMATNRCRGLLSLCISDAAKQMLLDNAGFIPHLIDGLMLDPEHPRKGSDKSIKTAVQHDFAECIQQISLFPAGCEALKANEAVMQVLLALKDKAWSDEAKLCAEGVLMALIPTEHHEIDDAEAFHIMMSCECTPIFPRSWPTTSN